MHDNVVIVPSLCQTCEVLASLWGMVIVQFYDDGALFEGGKSASD